MHFPRRLQAPCRCVKVAPLIAISVGSENNSQGQVDVGIGTGGRILDEETDFDVIIIGAGFAGASTAFNC